MHVFCTFYCTGRQVDRGDRTKSKVPVHLPNPYTYRTHNAPQNPQRPTEPTSPHRTHIGSSCDVPGELLYGSISNDRNERIAKARFNYFRVESDRDS